MKKQILLSVFSVLIGFASKAQTAEELKKFQDSLDITFPVVFHVIHGGGIEDIPDDQAIECLAQLNEDYNAKNEALSQVVPEFKHLVANIGVKFALARKTPEGKATTGIVHYYDQGSTVRLNGTDDDIKEKYGWPSDQYMNVYVIRSAGGESGSAWAHYPGVSKITDGVTASYWSVGRSRYTTMTHTKIMTHEVGHWSSLAHTFDKGCDSINDGVDDTPPTTVASGCDHGSSPCGVQANIQNFMDYARCTVMFTKGQKERMWRAYVTDPSRKNLYTKENLKKTGVTDYEIAAQYYAYHMTTYPGNAIQFHDFSETEEGVIEKYEWYFAGGTPLTFEGKTPPPVTYKEEGKFDVWLTVTNSNGKVSRLHKDDYIRVQSDISMHTNINSSISPTFLLSALFIITLDVDK